MTKFDIFVVNLERSADRREAMKRKIAKIRGFKAIYIDGELVVNNSSLGTPCGDFGNLGRFADAPVQSHAPNSQKTPQLPPQILELDSSESNESSLRGESMDSPKQSTYKSIARSATLKASSGAGVGVVREGEGSDFAIQAPTPSLKKNAHSQKGEFSADLSAESRKEIDSNVSLDSQDSFSQKGCTPHPAPPTRQKLPLFAFRGRASLSPLLAKNRHSHYCSLDSDFLHHEAGEIRCASHDSLELHFHFFPATDATKFKNGESPIPPQYSSKLTRFVKGKDLSFGEIACFSSHYRLWQKCVELDSPIIVLEDDIDFMQDFCQIIEIFKSPFEYVRLYYLFDRKITHLYDNFYISFGKTAGTQGYYLTPQAAQKFIKNARFWLFCVDDYMDMFFIHSVKNIIFKPFIISEDSLSAENSTILGREKPKMRFYQKLTRELSRIYFFVIRKYVYFALHCIELRAFFRANRR